MPDKTILENVGTQRMTVSNNQQQHFWSIQTIKSWNNRISRRTTDWLIYVWIQETDFLGLLPNRQPIPTFPHFKLNPQDRLRFSDDPKWRWFFTDLAVEALVPSLAEAGVAADPVFTESFVSARPLLAGVAICRTNAQIQSEQFWLDANFLIYVHLI